MQKGCDPVPAQTHIAPDEEQSAKAIAEMLASGAIGRGRFRVKGDCTR
jgi:hypothetical protein